MDGMDLSVREESAEIEKRIEKALKELDLIQKEKNLVKTADELEALERRIVEWDCGTFFTFTSPFLNCQHQNG
ncbi:MAG: hypothetical protein U5R49_22545 [Deltaproteobacteria bacterium]|nr:hypothetical protein [Deltaproteobacteria bacterium]